MRGLFQNASLSIASGAFCAAKAAHAIRRTEKRKIEENAK